MKTIQGKYFIIILPLLAAVLVILGVLTYKIGKKEQLETIQEMCNQVINARCQEVSSWLQSVIYELDQVRKDELVYGMNWSAMEGRLKEVAQKRNNVYAYLVLAHPDGSFYTSEKGKSDKNVSDRDYFKAIIHDKQDYFISNPKISKTTGLMVFFVAVPVKNKLGEIVGCLAGTIKLETLSKIAQQMKIGKTGYGWIVDATGVVAAHPNKDYLMKLNILKSDSIGFKNLDKVGQKMIEGKSGSDFIVSPTGVSKILFYKNIPTSPNWSLGFAVPESEIYEGINNLLLFTIIGFSLSIIMLFLAICWVTRRVVAKPIDKLTKVTSQISKGNLNQTIELKGEDEIVELGQAINAMIEKWREIILSINESISNVNIHSNQITESTQEMSQGASEQAAGAEEVSASVEQLFATIVQNTENSSLANQIARKAAKGMSEMQKSVNESITVMKDIAEKILIINEIATKTDILSINASIEAARAGEYGKGFAVVANEVGLLAKTTSSASVQIIELSKRCLSVTQSAAKLIDEVVPDVIKTSQIVEEITVASTEQNSGVQQINSTIQQFSSVIQQNASSSEEISYKALEMQFQAEKLEQAVSFFSINGNDADLSTREILEQIDLLRDKLAKKEKKKEDESLRSEKRNKLEAKVAKKTGHKIELEGDDFGETDNDFEKY